MPPLLTVVRSLMLSCLVLVTACNGLPVNTPAPQTPRLESVNLLGQRVCGTFTNSSSTFNFACDPLPASIGTGWLLTPPSKPHPTNPNWSILNRGIVFTVSTPTLTSIEIAYRAGSGARYVLSQVPPGPGTPQTLQAGPSEVEVAAADDGVRKTWTIAARTNTCLEKMELEIVNISGGTRSDTLPLHILRTPAEISCSPNVIVGDAPTPQIGTNPVPQPPPPPGPCAGGTPRTLFQFCERCPTGGRVWVQYTGIESCSLSDAKAVLGYGPNGVRLIQGCSISQTGSRAQCEGGP
jgi:hypothetical protein